MTVDPARRPGPRGDVDVQAKVVEAAEHLFALNGVGEASMRAVARAADVAPAAVTYYFPTKQDLVAAVIARRFDPVRERLHARLALIADSPTRPKPRDLMEAMILPIVKTVNDDPETGLDWIKILARLAQTDDPVFHTEMTHEPSFRGIFQRAAERVLTPYDEGAAQRTGLAMFTMLTALAGVDLLGYGRPLGPDGLDPAFVEQLIVYTSAGLAGE